eukprot:gnl/TRDRNA2_/TRDRNA2_170544_c1_seq1.p1 gnl/TRDRNA2_/TRDRNA2_170544_c1~~gnl/TRDRNA2_/TRDRNA2_170544_c1_seq1.p1  ORF type:complete len:534 (-),score=88.33 gnl/TRDRNA2_/TRDRNA2_170544_c1_seq1:160-1761(-)
MLFQLVLFTKGFLPRLNVPVSLIMLQDRTGYEVLQQKHVDQIMFGAAHNYVNSEQSGDTFEHVGGGDAVMNLYQYQDFTFAVSSMNKLLLHTLPVIAAKAYFLQRFDWRVDELLKADALLPAKAATRIAKVFKGDGRGFSLARLMRLLLLDGWWIGFRRIARFFVLAKHPQDVIGLPLLKKFWQEKSGSLARSNRRLWMARSGQSSVSSDGGRMRWVGVSLENLAGAEPALRRALGVSTPGDSVVAVHYPNEMSNLLSRDIFPEMENDIAAEVIRYRTTLREKVQRIVDENIGEGVNFLTYIGEASSYKPSYSMCEDAKEAKPYRIYVGYGARELSGSHEHTFAKYVVRNAPCDVSVIKEDRSHEKELGITRWVGISARSFEISAKALQKAFEHSHAGDTVVAVHYPTSPFDDDDDMMSNPEYWTSLAEAHLHTIVDNLKDRILERTEQVAKMHGKAGVNFEMKIGADTSTPHEALVGDARRSDRRPNTIYVGYNRRRDRDRLVDPHKMYDVAEYIVHNAPCSVAIIKDLEAR